MAMSIQGRALVTMTAMILSVSVLAEPNLVFNGDFELQAEQAPPPGWTMWGAQVYKTPANYTRDTTNPHSGRACFRIHHPADTAGYIVSSPQHAIRPQRGMMYAVSFWARADGPGVSQFSLTAYETIAPYRDAPSPGRWTIEVDQRWRRFEFTVHEGWEFFASRSRYVLLTFKAALEPQQERTLWADDIMVVGSPTTREGRMVDEAALNYEPLPHRLQPGDRLRLTVDAARPLGPATARAGGISFHRVCGWTGQPYNRRGEYTLDPKIEDAIRELRLPMTRLYAVGDEPFGVEGAIDRAAELVDRVAIPQQRTVLELETQSATTKLAPEVWARAVRHSLARGYGFRDWEVANEPYITRPGGAFPTPDDYVAHVKAVARAVREAQPDARVGVAINKGSTSWGNYVLRRAAGSYDFVAAHYYAVRDIHKRGFEAAVLTENYRTLDRILQLNALIKAYNPGREVRQLDTEWGMHSAGPKGERADAVDRNANIWGTMHRAVRLIYYVREGMLSGASSWQMLNRVVHQGFGVLAQEEPDKRFMLYWLYYYFNRHVGGKVLAISGTAPWYVPAQGDDPYVRPGEAPGPLTPVVATLSDDAQHLYLVVANGSWKRSIPCTAAVKGFRAARAEAIVLSHDDPNGKPLLQQKQDAVRQLPVTVSDSLFSCELPPHSVVFITLDSE